MSPTQNLAHIVRQQSGIADEFARDVIAGLSRPRKSVPCRYLYDARGSELFEDITRLPEYYPTRTEASILSAYANEMVEAVPAKSVLVEFGSGSSLKTEFLLDLVSHLVTYVPIDVSPSALTEAARRLAIRYPNLSVLPLVADFSQPVILPQRLASRPRIGFFPGSTIGNLHPHEAVRLLAVFRAALGCKGRLIIGIDLKKDARTLVQAYNDAAGVTAEFNLNLLARMNRELGASFDLSSFEHQAIYDPREGRIQMHLVSLCDQYATVLDRRFHFHAGETIHTENSYKYSIEQFRDLARTADWNPRRVWTDLDSHFSVHELTAD